MSGREVVVTDSSISHVVAQYLSDLQRRFYKIYLAARYEAMFKSLLNNLGSCF